MRNDRYDGLQRIRRRAADLVEKGWCQGNAATNVFGDVCQPEEPAAAMFCASGALRLATYEQWHSEWWRDAIQLIGQIRSELGLKDRSLANWNDDPDRTAAEVAAALRGND